MFYTLQTDNIAASTFAFDTFDKLAKVSLETIENLTTLNLNTLRESLEECATATKTLSSAMAANDTQSLPAVLGQPIWDKAFSYSRSGYEIIAKTQTEFSKVIIEQIAQANRVYTSAVIGQISQLGINLPVAASWSEMLDMYTKGFQQLGDNAANTARLVSDAGEKAVAANSKFAKKSA